MKIDSSPVISPHYRATVPHFRTLDVLRGDIATDFTHHVPKVTEFRSTPRHTGFIMNIKSQFSIIKDYRQRPLPSGQIKFRHNPEFDSPFNPVAPPSMSWRPDWLQPKFVPVNPTPKGLDQLPESVRSFNWEGVRR